jgi:hypothetical protein
MFFYTETLKWSSPNVYGKIPIPRDGHSACIIQNCMYIFGGFQEHPHQFSQHLYMLNLHTMVWSIIKTQVLYECILLFIYHYNI